MNEIEKKLWKKAKRYIWFLHFVPFVRMVAVCNSLAFGLVDKNSDIDLFVITEKNRLFLVRTFITGILQILGVRRHGKKIAGRFCLSFFVDDNYLNLEPIAIKNDLYLAHWIVSMKPFIDDGVSADFLKQNSWIKPLLKNWSFKIDFYNVVRNTSFIKNILKNFLNGKFGDFLEESLKKWQIPRALKKKSLLATNKGVIVDDHILKFHNEDRRDRYRRWFY